MKLESLPLAKFRLGRIVSTPTALSQLSQDDILLGSNGIRRATGEKLMPMIARRMIERSGKARAFSRCIAPLRASRSG